MVSQEDPELTLLHGHTERTPKYAAVSCEDELRADWAASAHKQQRAHKRKGGEN